jgi:hypothetical protein
VSQEMLKGYQMGNRVIRHSMVKVTAPAVEKKQLPDETNEGDIKFPS